MIYENPYYSASKEPRIYQNEFGTAIITPSSDFRGIKGLTNPIAIGLGADVFDLETAEKIALITENYAVQLSIGKNDLGVWESTLMLHAGPALVAPCKIEIIEFKCEGTPTQAIESERRKNAAHEAAAIIDMMMGF